jgi:hypothetical protein
VVTAGNNKGFMNVILAITSAGYEIMLQNRTISTMKWLPEVWLDIRYWWRMNSQGLQAA